MAIFELSSRLWSADTAPAPGRNPSPNAYSFEEEDSYSERDVRSALSGCITATRDESWQIVVDGLAEIEHLALDPMALAPATTWRAVIRAVTAHVRSLRSRVARAACCAIGALFEQRGRALDLEMDETAAALLERCVDVNKFLRADAADALVRLACGGSDIRVVNTLVKRGAGHRAGPVRAAAANALYQLIQHCGVARILSLPIDTRTILLRATGELLGDPSGEVRLNARNICLSIGESVRFRQMLREAMAPCRYKAIEKYVDKLHIH